MLEELLVLDEGKVLEVMLLLVEEDEGTVLLLLVDAVELLVVFEEGTALTKDGILVTLPVGETVLPL